MELVEALQLLIELIWQPQRSLVGNIRLQIEVLQIGDVVLRDFSLVEDEGLSPPGTE